MKRLLAVLVIFIAVVGGYGYASANSRADGPAAAKPAERPLVQIAILLDTSGSMQGLIDQAKTRLWAIVNEFALARRDGKQPQLEVALYQYGNDGLSPESYWVQQILPLTNDLDKVSEQLFKLSTNGGEEYCGAVIKHATEQLKWNESRDVYKAIFIAGNEPFNQGPINFREVCPKAIAKGILVNTIHCGSAAEGIASHWKDGAVLSDGAFINIDQNQRLADVATPHDKEIVRLNTALNGTYVPYGKLGEQAAQNQTVQDKNAITTNFRAFAQRGNSKSNGLYDTSAWDLIDAVKAKKVDLAKAAKEDLPKEIRDLDAAGRAKFVEAKAAEREKVRKELETLTATREKFVAEELKKLSKTQGDTLEEAIVKTVRSQAASKSLTFPAKP